MRTLAITNIGKIASGDIHNPLIDDADTIVCKDKKIEKIGRAEDTDLDSIDTIVDAKGVIALPGLVDGHCHVCIGGYNPRLKLWDWIDWARNNGVTTMVAAGDFMMPGMPTHPEGVKHHAVMQKIAYDNYRPSGVKVHGGAFLLQPGLTEEDFAELAAHGIWIVGEVGLGGIKTAEEAAPMIRWAEKYGMKSTMHFGGASVPGSASTNLKDLLLVRPTLVAHINGGSTAVPIGEVERLVKETDFNLDCVLIGNPLVRQKAFEWLKETPGGLARIQISVDQPGGAGVFTVGLLRHIVEVSSLCGISAPETIALATGNPARIWDLNVGKLEVGREADIVLLDKPIGSAAKDGLEAIEIGDVPGVAMVVIDGVIVQLGSNVTLKAERQVDVVQRNVPEGAPYIELVTPMTAEGRVPRPIWP